MHRRVFLIRHCQSEANRDERAESRGDSILTDHGVEQARRRARALAEHELTTVTIVASPLMRAARTAAEIAEHHGWQVTHDHRLVEGDLGALEDLSYDEVRAMIPAGASWVSSELHGGEAVEAVGERMLEVLTGALCEPPAVLILVSHGFAINALMNRLGQANRMIGNGDMLEVHFDEAAHVHRVEHHPLG
jgi:broad specificity phosphatase PhoE